MSECGCLKCTGGRVDALRRAGGQFLDLLLYPMRYACEVCGNKRCPHHTDHTLACTDSNEPGQPGSEY